MASANHNRMLKNLAIVMGAAGTLGFLTIPAAMHLANHPNAVAELFAGRADAQTVTGSDGSSAGAEGGTQGSQTAPAATQGSQPLQEQTQPPLGQTNGTTPQPLFPNQGTGINQQQTTGGTAQGSQPIQPQNSTGNSPTGAQNTRDGRTLPEQAAPGAQRVTNQTGAGQTTQAQPSTSQFGTNQPATGSSGQTTGAQQVPFVPGGASNGAPFRNTRPDGVTTGTGGTSTGVPQSSSRTVVSPGVVGGSTVGTQGVQPVTGQVPTTQQAPANQQVPSSQQVAPQSGQNTLSTQQVPAQSAVDQTTQTYDQTQTTTQDDAQYGQAVRALW